MLISANMGERLWSVLRPLGWIAVALVLLAPAVAMNFTNEVQWTASDFGFAAALLIGGGLVVEIFAWQVRNPIARIGFGLFVVAVVAVIWGSAI